MKRFRNLLIGIVTLALVGASAASENKEYKLELTQALQVGGTPLKPGKYKVEIQGDKAVFKSGKDVVAQAPATVETGKQNFVDTSLVTSGSSLSAISVGGTKLTIVLKP